MEYLLHGLRMRSDLVLAAPPVTAAERYDVDLTRASGRPPVDGPLICEVEAHPGGIYRAHSVADGYVLAYEDTYAFHLRDDLRKIEWWSTAEGQADVGQVVAGNVLSFLLQLSGHYVCHASAVKTRDATFAFAGGRGAGKTTLAALFCAVGGLVVTDDALRIDIENGQAFCYSGSFALRLRIPAPDLGLEALPSTRSEDGRFVTSAEGAPGSHPLHALFVPTEDPAADAIYVDRLSEKEALLDLLRFPRWFGWRTAHDQRHEFRRASALAGVTPVFALTTPSLRHPALREHILAAAATIKAT